MIEIILEEKTPVDRAVREFRRKVIRSGLMDEMRKKQYAMKPSVAKKEKKIAANKRKHRARKARRQDAGF